MAKRKGTARQVRIYEREPGGALWYDFRFNGKRYRESTGTRNETQAQAAANKRWDAVYRIDRLGEKPATSWREAVLTYIRLNRTNVTIEQAAARLQVCTPIIGEDTPLDKIDVDTLLRVQETLIDKAPGGHVKRHRATLKQSSVDLYMAHISAVLRCARDNGRLVAVPKIPRFNENNCKTLYATPEQAAALIAACPPTLRQLVRFALQTGLRKQNACGLQWSEVDLERRVVRCEHHKTRKSTGRALIVPLSDEAVAIIREQLGKHDSVVFPNERGERYVEPNSWTFWKARDAAGLPADFTFHSLRHTWATWHVMAGTPLMMLQRLGGWESLKMVQRYAHPDEDHVATYANNVGKPKPGLRIVKGAA